MAQRTKGSISPPRLSLRGPIAGFTKEQPHVSRMCMNKKEGSERAALEAEASQTSTMHDGPSYALPPHSTPPPLHRPHRHLKHHRHGKDRSACAYVVRRVARPHVSECTFGETKMETRTCSVPRRARAIARIAATRDRHTCACFA